MSDLQTTVTFVVFGAVILSIALDLLDLVDHMRSQNYGSAALSRPALDEPEDLTPRERIEAGEGLIE